ncbi:MAG: hypothetical protein QXP72_03745 [Desulfurococcaceae archaeon]|uniref:Uncharacterized protein n=1 Tax=Staphylothermus marinus TaxID=2280 RepID=A0A7C4JLU7_STAMA
MKSIRRIKWLDGYLLLETTFDYIMLKSANIAIEVKPKTIIVKGAENYRIYRTSFSQYIYVYFVEKLKPFTNYSSNNYSLENLSIRIENVKTSIGDFCIIKLPEQFNIQHLIITEEKICIAIHLKRKLTTELIENTVIIYVY